jgi:hypothetical protein
MTDIADEMISLFGYITQDNTIIKITRDGNSIRLMIDDDALFLTIDVAVAIAENIIKLAELGGKQ